MSMSSLEFDIDMQQILKQHLSRTFLDLVQIVVDADRRSTLQLSPKVTAQLLDLLEGIELRECHILVF